MRSLRHTTGTSWSVILFDLRSVNCTFSPAASGPRRMVHAPSYVRSVCDFTTMAYDCRPHYSTDSNEPMLPYPPSYRQTARSDGNVTATSTSHRVRVPTTIRMRDLQIQTKHLAQPFRSKTMLQITRIHDSARRRIVAGHIIRIRVRLITGDTSHDRHMVEALRNLLKTVRHQNHGAVRLLRTNTTQRTQSNLTPTQIKTRGRLVKNQQIGDPPSTHGR